MLYDRVKPQESTIVKVFRSKGLITCLSYGPYDNGHVLVGTSTGDFLAFDSLSLTKICNVKVSERSAVSSMTIDPTQAVLVGCQGMQEITSLTFIEEKQKYIYLELGSNKFATVVLKHDQQSEYQQRIRSRNRNRSQDKEDNGCMGFGCKE